MKYQGWILFMSWMFTGFCAIFLVMLIMSYPDGEILITTNDYGEMIPEIIGMSILTIISSAMIWKVTVAFADE